MKICFVIKAFGQVRGGAERVLAGVASALAARGHMVAIVSFDQPGQEPPFPLADTVRLYQLGRTSPYHPTDLAEAIARIRTLRAHVRQSQPDVVIGFMHSAFVLLPFALFGLRIPFIASEHIIPAHYRGKWVDYALMILAAKLAARMSVVSAQVRGLYPSFLRSQIEVMANPVTMPVQLAPRPRKNADERHRILCMARLDPQKDQATLIAAFARIASRFPHWELRLIGEGGLRDSLHTQAAQTGLGDRVNFVPAVTATAASDEYNAADLFVLPSRYESFGLVVAEALAHGLPAVAFADCPGLNVLIENGKNGVLVSGDDRVAALAEALAALMSDPERRISLGQAGPASVADYRLDHIARKWEELITSCKR